MFFDQTLLGKSAGSVIIAKVSGIPSFNGVRSFLTRQWVLGLAFLLYLPLIFLGYGSDVDTFRVLDAGRNFMATADYVPSRRPGYLVYELAAYVLDRLGGSVLSNLGTLFWALAALACFLRICRRHKIQNSELLALIFAIHPVFWYNATVSIDYIWALGMLLVGFDLLEQHRFYWAGLALGLAVGCRLSSVIVVAGLLTYAWLAFPKRRFQAVVMGGMAGLLGGLAYILPWDFAEWRASFWTLSIGSPALWTPTMQMGRFVYKNLYFWGLPAALFMALIVLLGISRFRLKGRVHLLLMGLAASVVFGYEILFFRFPIEVEYLLPVLPFIILLVGINAPSRTWLRLLLVLVLSYNLVTVNLARPNNAGQASSAVLGVWIEPGYLLQEIRSRLVLLGCADHACYDERIAQRPAEGFPDQ